MINGVLIITLGIVKAKVKTCIMLIGLNRINFSNFVSAGVVDIQFGYEIREVKGFCHTVKLFFTDG